jgi:DNA topoisomerase-1
MKKLLIVESPAKIKTISKILGNDFKIMSTVGHIKDLPAHKIGVKIDKKGEINIDYVVMKNKEQVINEIVKAAQKCDEILLAPDPDREGEIIAWHIGEEIAKVMDRSKIRRITFNEITKEAILDSIQHTSDINMQRVAAQQARRVLDRWVGYEVSPILWRKITRGLSAGRVQSVALKLVCDRESAIRAFKPEEFWSIIGQFAHQKEKFEAELVLIDNKKFELKNQQETDLVVTQIKKAEYKIKAIEDKKRTKNPVAPFMTSTLQQAAYNQLGFSVKKTMQVAQKLYEGMPLQDADTPVALITYMRTDSLRIADSAIESVRNFISKNFDKNYLPTTPNTYAKNKKTVSAQDAHEAIRPISVDLKPENISNFLGKDAAKLYELIWKRFVACQMKPAVYAQRTVTINGDRFTFKIVGSTLIFDGFLKVYKDEDEEDKKIKIPKSLEADLAVNLDKVDPKQHFTQAPPRYTEASLVKELEKEGIGRPSTYASILTTIQARAYTELDDKKRFVPTELGFAVTNLLATNLPKIMNTKFTAHMEDDLDKISQGELARDKLLNEFYGNFKDDLKKFSDSDSKQAREIDMLCPTCKKHNLAIKFGKAGEFLGCSNYPECNFTSNFVRTEDGQYELKAAPEPIILDEKCPTCGKNLRELVGKYGKFISCSGYPTCKYIKQEKADVHCSVCQNNLVKRRWIGGEFWGCASYPKCKFAVFGDIAQTPCPKCKHPFMGSRQLKTGTVVTCPNNDCKYKHKN